LDIKYKHILHTGNSFGALDLTIFVYHISAVAVSNHIFCCRDFQALGFQSGPSNLSLFTESDVLLQSVHRGTRGTNILLVLHYASLITYAVQ